MNNFKWNIGAFNIHTKVLKQILETGPSKIESVFGGVPCLFSGGRFSNEEFDFDSFKSNVSYLNFRGISVRLTFSSTLICKEDLKDFRSNQILDFLNKINFNLKINNGVIICSDILLKYIREKYPNIIIISSFVKIAVETNFNELEETPNYYNQLLQNYDYVVLNHARVNQSFLSSIEDLGRIEVIVNSHCLKNCPWAKYHYEAVSKINRGIEVKTSSMICNQLSKKCHEILKNDSSQNISFPFEDLEELFNMGLRHFKLEGRELSELDFEKELKKYKIL